MGVAAYIYVYIHAYMQLFNQLVLLKYTLKRLSSVSHLVDSSGMALHLDSCKQ